MFVVLVLCGVGLPLPEEIVLVGAGYVSYLGKAHAGLAFATCAFAILVGDSIPFFLGRIFGPKLLKIRLVRTWITTERLARLDRWFAKRGRLTIFLARFLTGIRVPAFFAAGSMRMGILRFLVMDALGLLTLSPLFVFLGVHFGPNIDVVFDWVRRTERGIQIVVVLLVLGTGVWMWFRLGRRRRLLGRRVRETFVEARAAPERRTEDPEGEAAPIDVEAPGPGTRPAPPGDAADASDGEEPSPTLEPPAGHR